MQTTLALDRPLPADAVITVATRLAEMLEVDIPIDARLLRCLFESATSSSDASAGWSMHDAYHALELAQILYLTNLSCPIALGCPAAALSSLQALAARLPTQSYRSGDQLDLQQFSTPIPIAWLAGMAAAFRAQDLVLEPSAGTGLLVWPAARTGSRLTLNEIDVRRRACLKTAFPTAAITGHDAEILDDLLPASLSADVVIMNPPFARSHGRGDDRHAAVRHLDAVWKRLRTGGRLVAIMPDRFSARGWADSRPDEATLRLDARLAEGLYAKQGTGIAVRLIVIDKLVDTVAPTSVETGDLGALLEPIGSIPARSAAALTTTSTPPRLSLFGHRHSGRPALAPTPVRSQSADLAEALDLVILEDPAPVGDQVGIYLPWRPSRLNIPDACEHPTPLVESIAMGSVAAPKPTYRPCLPRRLVTDGVLSSAQLETLVYAGDAFERDTPGLLARGEIGPVSLALTVLERVNLTSEELRYAQNYAPGMVLDVSERGEGLRLPMGRADILAVDATAGIVKVRTADGRERTLRPDRLRPAGEPRLQLYERKDVTIHERDRIRWTASDHKRGLFNADRAQITRIDGDFVSVETSLGVKLELKPNDPMLQRLDLAYALNAHMAQGLTSDGGIAVMETRDTKLVNQQTFLVTVTRLRDTLTLIVDRADGLQRQLIRNAGGKTSSLETTGGIPRGVERDARDKLSMNGPDRSTPAPEKALDLDGGRSKIFEIGI